MAAGQLLQHDGQIAALLFAEFGESSDAGFRHQQCFEGPGRPVWNDREPMRCFDDDTDTACFLIGVVQKQRATVLVEVGALVRVFRRGFVWQEAVGPDLAVRMRHRAPHHRTLVLENLHPGIVGTQVYRLHTPGGNHLFDCWQGEFRKALAVIRRKTDDPAGTACRAILEKRIIGDERIRCINGPATPQMLRSASFPPPTKVESKPDSIRVHKPTS